MRVLHLEDSENDQSLVAEMLRVDCTPCEIVAVKTENEFESTLEKNKYDLIISDFSLPCCDPLKALEIVRKLCPQTPFIFFSGTIGEDVAVKTLKHGATEYVFKQRPQRLTAAIPNTLQIAQERARSESMEREMRELQEQILRAQNPESLASPVR